MKKIIFFDIDTQFDFMRKKGRLYVNDAQAIIPNLKRLTHFAEKNKIAIIASVDAHSSDDPEFKMFPSHCVKGSSGQRKISQTLIKKHIFIGLKKRAEKNIKNILKKYGQVILEKKTFDVFSNPNTKTLLQDTDTAFVYGVATDYCVRACCLGLLKLKKKVNLVVDAIKPVSIKQGQKTLRLLKQRGVRLIRTKSLINIKR